MRGEIVGCWLWDGGERQDDGESPGEVLPPPLPPAALRTKDAHFFCAMWFMSAMGALMILCGQFYGNLLQAGLFNSLSCIAQSLSLPVPWVAWIYFGARYRQRGGFVQDGGEWLLLIPATVTWISLPLGWFWELNPRLFSSPAFLYAGAVLPGFLSLALWTVAMLRSNFGKPWIVLYALGALFALPAAARVLTVIFDPWDEFHEPKWWSNLILPLAAREQFAVYVGPVVLLIVLGRLALKDRPVRAERSLLHWIGIGYWLAALAIHAAQAWLSTWWAWIGTV